MAGSFYLGFCGGLSEAHTRVVSLLKAKPPPGPSCSPADGKIHCGLFSSS